MDSNSGFEDRPVYFRELDRAGRRRAVVRALVRSLVVTVVVLGCYFLIPVGGFDGGGAVGAWIRLAGVVLVFTGALALQLQMIMAAHVPQIRAATAVGESVLIFLCLFSLLYLSISVTDPLSFSESLGRIDALYFTTSTFATVGFGDITPSDQLARTVVTIQIIADLGALLLIAKVTFSTASRRLHR
ncbi:ion channel [Arthrobacter sp. NPDC092385]|uniref:ion channel n=1 Tax=Arthrobacter sp. NPDC092385 TaxID=3363943 RepID=UPI0037F44EE9